MRLLLLSLLLLASTIARAGVGDPQVSTDDPWYPGELSCSTFERLFATQAALYKRVTGRDVSTDEDKVLASWLWRNTHYFHAEEGAEDLWGKGFSNNADMRTREYWTGLFAHGYGLCGTTHAQWVAEMEALLGHGRARDLGCNGHNSFEVFLTGGPYGKGQWVLLDHDLSTIVYDPTGKRLLSLKEVSADWKKLTDRKFAPERQHGWLICGLHPNDNGSYSEYRTAEYFPGYAGPPPMVHLRRGETLRRYLQPGLDDGKTFVFWGRNYNAGGIPGPERSLTWVNQPETMFNSKTGVKQKQGQARYGNAVYTYRPDLSTNDYLEGVISQDDTQVTFEFRSPYIIGATPAKTDAWAIYQPGCRNGLVVRGAGGRKVSVSVDRGQSWRDGVGTGDTLDFTDTAKGSRQYWLRVNAGPKALASSGLTITTVCEANAAVMPRLKDHGSNVRFEASGQAVVSAGPTVPQAHSHIIDGKFDSSAVTLGLATPRGEPIAEVHAAAHVRSSNPPSSTVKYQIESSTDSGTTWKPMVLDWTINRQGEEPKDFWSQSMMWGQTAKEKPATNVQVRFKNSGGKQYARAEVHAVYRLLRTDDTKVTFAWTDAEGEHTLSHVIPGAKGVWTVPTSKGVKTKWVEFEPVK